MCVICEDIERGGRELLIEWDGDNNTVTQLAICRNQKGDYKMAFGTFCEDGRPIAEGDLEIQYCPFCGREVQHQENPKYPWNE